VAPRGAETHRTPRAGRRSRRRPDAAHARPPAGLPGRRDDTRACSRWSCSH